MYIYLKTIYMTEYLHDLINKFDKEFKFGKYNGFMYSQVYKIDKSYCKWIIDQEWFDDTLSMNMIIKANKKIRKIKKKQ